MWLSLTLSSLLLSTSAFASTENPVFDSCTATHHDLSQRIQWAASLAPTPIRSEKELTTARAIEHEMTSLNPGRGIPKEFLVDFIKRAHFRIRENINSANTFLITLKKEDTEKLADSLNVKIDLLNQLLAENPVKVSSGAVFDSPDFSEENKKFFTFYQRAYYILSSDGVGPLIWTTTLQQKVGPIRHIETDLQKYDSKSVVLKSWYFYKPHERINASDVSLAIDNASFLLEKLTTHQRELQSTLDQSTESELIQEIKHLTMTYPTAIGQTLTQAPEYSVLICRTLSGLAHDQIEKDERDKLYDQTMALATAASVALGGAGAAVRGLGIGFKEAAGQLWKYATQSASFGALFNGSHKVETFSHLMGRTSELRTGYLGKSNDEKSLKEANEVLEELDRTYDAFMWDVGGAALGVPSIRKFALIQKYGSISLAKQIAKIDQTYFLMALTDILKAVNQSPALKSKFLAARAQLGERTVDRFFVQLTDLPKAKQMETLSQLEKIGSEAEFASTVEFAIDELKTLKTLGTNLVYAKKVKVEHFRKTLEDIFDNDLDTFVKDLAKEFKISEYEMIRKISQAKTTVSEILEEVRAGKGFFAKLKAGLNDGSFLKDPSIFMEVFRNPRLLTGVLMWQFRNRTMANAEIKRMLAIFVTINISTTIITERSVRGDDFWNEWDIFLTDLVTMAITEAALVTVGAKTLSSAKTVKKFIGKSSRNLPDNIFDSGYSVSDRLIRYGSDGIKVVGISSVTTIAGHQLTKTFLVSDEAPYMDKKSNIDLSTYLITMESFLLGSSTLRYYALNFGIDKITRLLGAGRYGELKNLIYTSISLGNDSLGTIQFVWWQKFINEHQFFNEAN